MSFLSIILLGTLSALRVPGPLSERGASYTIEATLDAPSRELHGKAKLTWRNVGTTPVAALPVHLYLNAFKNERSTYIREARFSESPIEIEAGRWGFVRLDEVSGQVAGKPIDAKIVLDPGEETLAYVQLDPPLSAGETIELRMGFVTRLPQIASRAGVDHGFYAVGQWFPKVAALVCDPVCAFHAAAYHADSEFFADFGVYDVTLDLPSELVVAATGIRLADRVNGARRTLVLHAEDVHDFAWSADAAFTMTTTEVDDGSGLPPVTLRIFSTPSSAAHTARHLEAARAGLVELGHRLGWYPYRELSIVQPPKGGDEAAGMEYPTLFYTYDAPAPATSYLPELVTAHELAHQWFQGMVASNEVEEPWLDEGLAERATAWVLARLAPPRAAVYRIAGHELDYAHSERVEIIDERADPVVTAAEAYRDHAAYSRSAYRRPSLLLATLEARLGPETFMRLLRGYVDRARFHHPRTADFLAAFAEAPAPLRELLDDGLRLPVALDYAITAVHAAADQPARGLFEGANGKEVLTSTLPPTRWINEVVVERLGELRIDVTVRAHFSDGSHADRVLPRETPDAPRWRRIGFEGPSELTWAELHPDDDTPLDAHRWNDGLRVKPDRRPRRSILLSLRMLATLLLSWVGR